MYKAITHILLKNSVFSIAKNNLLLLLFAFSLAPLPAFSQSFGITCYDDIVADYHKFLDGRDPLKITDFTGEHSRRDVVEVVMLQQAAALGGFPHTMTPYSKNNTYKRNLSLVKSGHFITNCASLWRHDVESESVYISSAVIPGDKFIAGIYTLASRNDEIKINTAEDITHFKAICNKSWEIDYSVLQQLNANCVFGNKWSIMVDMLAKGRGDILLAPFQSNKGSLLQVNEHILKPIPNVKLALNNDRVFIVSKKHAYGEKLYEALEKGLTMMREQGTIEKIYTESGFYNPAVADWKLLNPPEQPVDQ